MNIFHAIILGVVEGFSEYLPISSTGHLILASYLLDLRADDFLKSFEISIQLGAIIAVVMLYWKEFLVRSNITKKLIVAFIPTGIVGFIFYKTLRSLFFESTAVVLWSLFIGGIILIIFEWRYREKEHATRELDSVSYQQSFFIGLMQSISIIPGVSRAASTIVGGLVAGLDRKTVVEFSFLLAVPTMLAAASFDLWKNASSFSLEHFRLLTVGFVTSLVVAIFSIKFLLRFITRHTFVVFGIYRIMAAFIFWFM